MHLRVNDTTVEVSHDELPQNFPDALQIDICNTTLHFMNDEDVRPTTMVVRCNPQENLLLQMINDPSPGTNTIVFAKVPIHINGTDFTCNLRSTNSVELSLSNGDDSISNSSPVAGK